METTLHFSTFKIQRPARHGRRWLLIVLAIMLLVATVAPSIHAQVKHGVEASAARQCTDGSRHMFLFRNADTKRFGTVCDLGGIWGVVILDEAGNEITAFLKNKMRTFEQVRQYMHNAGYELLFGASGG